MEGTMSSRGQAYSPKEYLEKLQRISEQMKAQYHIHLQKIRPSSPQEVIEQRMKALYAIDDGKALRKSYCISISAVSTPKYYRFRC